MAVYSYCFTSVPLVGTADGVDLADGTYLGTVRSPFVSLSGRLKISEIFMAGEEAFGSFPTLVVLGGNSNVMSSGFVSGGYQTLVDASSTDPVGSRFTGNATTNTKPQRSATYHFQHLSFNALGGVVRWVANYGRELLLGAVNTTSPYSEVSLSAYPGGTPGHVSGHIIVEVI